VLVKGSLRIVRHRTRHIFAGAAIAVAVAGGVFAPTAYADRNPDPDRPCANPNAISPNGNETACTACQKKYSNLPDQQTIGWLCGQQGGVAPKFTNMPCYVFFRSENRVEYQHNPDCEGIEII
jgi:hypothetical protein